MFVQMTVLEIKNSGKADKCKEKHGFPAGVQKVCKSVQTGKLKPTGQINHRFFGRV